MSEELTKDDLVLLMESYRNMITMHQTILDQTSKTIDKLDGIATKQDSLFSKQGSVCLQLGNINGKVDKLDTGDNIDELKAKVIDKLQDHEKKSIEDHGKITNKIYIGWIGMGTIIMSIIGLAVVVTNLIKINLVP